jgi:hypothetical protein
MVCDVAAHFIGLLKPSRPKSRATLYRQFLPLSQKLAVPSPFQGQDEVEKQMWKAAAIF